MLLVLVNVPFFVSFSREISEEHNKLKCCGPKYKHLKCLNCILDIYYKNSNKNLKYITYIQQSIHIYVQYLFEKTKFNLIENSLLFLLKIST